MNPVRKLCSEPGCSGTRPCPAHGRGGWARWKLTHRGDPYGGEWRQIRARVLAEEPRCRMCGAKATHVDHIQPISRGGTHARSNLRGLCARCHRRVTADDFGWSGRLTVRRWRGGGGSP